LLRTINQPGRGKPRWKKEQREKQGKFRLVLDVGLDVINLDAIEPGYAPLVKPLRVGNKGEGILGFEGFEDLLGAFPCGLDKPLDPNTQEAPFGFGDFSSEDEERFPLPPPESMSKSLRSEVIGHHDKVEAGGLSRRNDVLDSPRAIVRQGGMAV